MTATKNNQLPETVLGRLRSDSDAEEARRAKPTTETADARYAKRINQAHGLLQKIEARLMKHEEEQRKSPGDWGFPGDLGHVNEELALVLASLGDRSAVDAMGISC